MRSLRNYISRPGFIKNLFLLMRGSFVGQVLPLLVIPVLTRHYTPAEFGLYGFYLSLCFILAVPCTGGYHLAIILERKRPGQLQLLFLSLLLTGIVVAFYYLVILLLPASLFPDNALGHLFGSGQKYFIPITVLLLGGYQSLYYFLNKNERFKALSAGIFLKGLSYAVLAVLFGYLKMGTIGLIFSNIFSFFLADCFFFLRTKINWNEISNVFHKLKIYALAKRYRSFPQYFIAGQFFNKGSSESSQLLYNTFFTPVKAGLIFQVSSLLAAPVAFIGQLISDVFRHRAVSDMEASGSCRRIYLKTALSLVAFSIIPTIAIFFFGREIFAYFLGDRWAESGIYAEILIFAYFFSFCTSPVSSVVIQITQNLKIDLIWQIAFFILSISSIYIGYSFFKEIRYSVLFFTISYCFMSVLNFLIAYWFTIKRT